MHAASVYPEPGSNSPIKMHGLLRDSHRRVCPFAHAVSGFPATLHLLRCRPRLRLGLARGGWRDLLLWRIAPVVSSAPTDAGGPRSLAAPPGAGQQRRMVATFQWRVKRAARVARAGVRGPGAGATRQLADRRTPIEGIRAARSGPFGSFPSRWRSRFESPAPPGCRGRRRRGAPRRGRPPVPGVRAGLIRRAG